MPVVDARHFLFPCSNSYQYPTAAFTRPGDEDADTYKSYIPFVILVDTVLSLLLLLSSDRVITSTPGSVVVPGDSLCFWLAEGGIEGGEVDISVARRELKKLPLSWGELSVENPGISYSDILILIPDSRTVYDLIFTLFILLTLSR